MNFLSAEVHKGFVPLFDPAVTSDVHAAAMADLARKFTLIDKAFSDGRPYLTGWNFTIADAYLFVLLGWPPYLRADLAKQSSFDTFRRRVAGRPAVQAALLAEGLQLLVYNAAR